jgi:hypothetical protein
MSEPPARPPATTGRSLAAIAVVVVAAAAVLAWLLSVRDGKHRSASTAGGARSAVLANGRALRALAAGLGYPVYWAGRIAGRKVELTQTGSGNVFLRYLTPKARVGDPRPDFLTVGTYPLPRAFAATRAVARRPGMIVRKLAHGGIAITNQQRRTSVYLAYPGSSVQIEVYDPDGARALRLVLRGRIRPIPTTR